MVPGLFAFVPRVIALPGRRGRLGTASFSQYPLSWLPRLSHQPGQFALWHTRRERSRHAGIHPGVTSRLP